MSNVIKKLAIIVILIFLICVTKAFHKWRYMAKKESFDSYIIKIGNKYVGKNEHLTFTKKSAIEVTVNKNYTTQKMVINQVDSRHGQSLYLKHIPDHAGKPTFKFSEFRMSDRKFYLFDYSPVNDKSAYYLKNQGVYVIVGNNKLQGSKDRNIAAEFEFIRK